MATPETKLPPPPQDGESSIGLDPEKAESYKRPHDGSISSSIADGHDMANGEIIWHYMTFETELPSPAHLARSPDADSHRSSPSQCPDLTKYTSPFLWSKTRKSFMTWMSCAATVVTAYTAGSYAAAMGQLHDQWHFSETALTSGISVFTCGFGIAPMFLAPFSEINGRRPVFVVTGILFVLFQLICAVTPTFAGMLIARFLAGCMSSTFSTMVGGVVSDIYHAHDRNTAMALFAGAAMLGTGLGPLCSGFLAQHTTWRWVFYLQVITCGSMMLLIVFFFKETRGSVLLSRKAKVVNKWYDQLEAEGLYGMMMPLSSDPSKTSAQRIRWKVKSDEERASLGTMIAVSLYRPFHLLVTEPVVFFFSCWISFSWATLYLLFSAVPLIFETNHDFNLEQADAVFTAVSVASIISTLIAIYQEKLARKYLPEKHQAMLETPEGRLFFACIQSALLPIGCFWLAWTQFRSIPWIVPALGIGCATMGIFSIYLAVFNYLADTYHRYASSALAAQSFCRNILAGAFPLFTPQMFKGMTFQGAGSFLGGVGALLTIVPFVLVFYGPKIRARSKIASEILKTQ